MSLFYSNEFFETHLQKQWLEEVNTIAKILFEKFRPRSVVDFGCGVGSYLHFFSKLGVEVQGYEKSEKALKYSLIDRSVVTKHDLRKPLLLSRKYDLPICFEVLEHISRKFEDRVLDTICSSADIICLSAATPSQGGMDHVNERPHQHWIRKMKERGFNFLAHETIELRREMSDRIKEMPWMKENIIIFMHEP